MVRATAKQADGGWISRADKTLSRLRSFRDLDLASYNSLFLLPACPKEWKPKITAERYKAAAAIAGEFDPGELEEARRRIVRGGGCLEPFLCHPGEMMEEGDLAFWEAAMCTLPRDLRPAAARRYWLFPLFWDLDTMAQLL